MAAGTIQEMEVLQQEVAGSKEKMETSQLEATATSHEMEVPQLAAVRTTMKQGQDKVTQPDAHYRLPAALSSKD